MKRTECTVFTDVTKKLSVLVISFLLAFTTISNYINDILVKAEDEAYRVSEVKGKRDEYSTTYLNSDGTLTVELYTTAIRYYDGDELVDVDTSIEIIDNKTKQDMLTEYDYKSSTTAVDIFLPNQINTNTPVLLTRDKYSVSLVPITSSSIEESIRNNDNSELETSFVSASKSTGELKKETVEDIYGESKEKNTRILYDAFTDEKSTKDKNAIEIEYILENDGIKENIIINRNVGIYRFDFLLRLEGCEPVLTEYGAIVLVDDKSGNDIGVIPVPMAYDVNEIEFENYEVVSYELNKADDEYILSIIVDKEYLENKERSYPVVIDPTITIGNTDIQEAYVLSANPGTNYYSSGVYVMRIGYDSGFKVCRTYMRFANLESQISGKLIINAELQATVNYVNSGSKATLERVSEAWTPSTVKWNNKPASVNDMDVTSVAASSGRKKWDVTKTVQEWASGIYPNYGFCLKATAEGSTSKSFSNFFGSRHATASRRPALIVTYVGSVPEVYASIEGGEANSEKNAITLSFNIGQGYQPQNGNEVSDEFKHFILIAPTEDPQDPRITKYEITNEINWDNNYTGTWVNDNSSIFSNKGGVLDSSSKVFNSNTEDYYVALVTENHYGYGIESEWFELKTIDRTAPSKVDVQDIIPELTYVNGENANNSVEVSFLGVSDARSDMYRYEVEVTSPTLGIKNTFVAHNGINNTHTAVVTGISISDPYQTLVINAYDIQQNYSTSNGIILSIERPLITINNIDDFSYIKTGTNIDFSVNSTEALEYVTVKLLDPSGELVIYENTSENLYTLVNESAIIGDISEYEDGQYLLRLEAKGKHGKSIENRYVLINNNTELTGDILNIEDPYSELSGVFDILLNVDGSYYFDKGALFDNLENLRNVGFSLSVYHNDTFVKELTTEKTIYPFDTTLLLNGDYELRLHIYDDDENEITISKNIVINNQFRRFDYLDWKKGDNDEICITLGYKIIPFISNGFYYRVNDELVYNEIQLINIITRQLIIDEAILTEPDENIIRFYHLSSGQNAVYSEIGVLTITNDSIAPVVTANSIVKIQDLQKFIIDFDVTDDNLDYWDIYGYIDIDNLIHLKHSTEEGQNLKYLLDITGTELVGNDFTLVIKAVDTGKNETEVPYYVELKQINEVYISGLVDNPNITVSIDNSNDYRNHLHVETGLINQQDEETIIKIYRGYESDFVLGSDNYEEYTIYEKGPVSFDYFDNKLILGKNSYYVVEVIKEVSNINVSYFSNEYSILNISNEEFNKRIGIKSEYETANIAIPNCNAEVELSGGNLLINDVDLELKGIGFDLAFGRIYNSQGSGGGFFGKNWMMGVNYQIYQIYTQVGNQIVIDHFIYVDNTGASTKFYPRENSISEFMSSNPQFDELKIVDEQVVIETRSKTKLYFDQRGKIKEVIDPNNNALVFKYDEKTDYITSISNRALITTDTGSEEGSLTLLNRPDEEGKSLANFYFNNNRLQKIEVPNERSIEYSYNIVGLLSGVKYYGYENNSKVLLSKKSYGYKLISNELDTIYDGMGNKYSIYYDKYGKVDKVKYPNNEGFNINYDNEVVSRNVSVQNYIQSSTVISTSSYVFDGDGRALSITDAAGNTTNNVYQKGYLVSSWWQVERASIIGNQVVTQMMPLSVSYQYDMKGNLIRAVDERGNITVNSYDSDNNIINTKSYTTNEDIFNDESYIYALTVNDINIQLAEMTDNLEEITTTMTYDDNGDLNESSTVIDGVGEFSSFESESYYEGYLDDDYDLDDIDFEDEEGYSVEIEQESNGDITITTLVVIDKYGNTIYEKDEKGYYTEYIYDGLSRVIETRRYDNPNTVTSTYKSTFSKYNYNNSLIEDKHLEYYNDSNGNPTSSNVITSYQYDNMNRNTVATTIPNLVSTTTYSYENVTLYYDNQSQTINNASKESTLNEDGTTSITWSNHLGETVKIQTATDITYYKYDINGRQTIVYESPVSGGTSGGLITYSMYDEYGNTIGEIKNPTFNNNVYGVNYSSIATFSQYDSFGNKTKDIDGEGYFIEYIYNNQQKLIALKDQELNRYDFYDDIYQKMGNQVFNIQRVVYPNGAKSEDVYDSFGNLVEVRDLGNGQITPIVTKSIYDESGNLIRENHMDGNYIGNYQVYTYDENGNMISSTSYNDGGLIDYKTTYEYDSNDKLTKQIDKDGVNNIKVVKCYMYDIQGRVIRYYEGNNLNPTLSDYFTYEYDQFGNLYRKKTPFTKYNIKVKTYMYGYNNKNMIAVEIRSATSNNGDGYREYLYDKYNRISEITDYLTVGNATVKYRRVFNYDIFGRVESILVYDEHNMQTEFYYYSYNRNSQINSESSYNQYLGLYEYKYYSYETTRRLVQYQDSNNNINYSYDLMGNMILEVNNGILKNYYYNSLNQLETTNDNTKGITQYSYDVYGNQISMIGTNDKYKYHYDSYNRLLHVDIYDTTYGNSQNGYYIPLSGNEYYGDGTRSSKIVNDYSNNSYKSTFYEYENGNLHHTFCFNGSNSEYTEYVNDYSGNVVASIVNDSEYYMYHKDIRDSTTSILNATGDMSVGYTYLPFGETETYIGSGYIPNNEICYTGAIYDSETGLYYMNARYYSPSDARFITQDTYRGDRDDYSSLHLYAYCSNDPINNTDPTGHKAKKLYASYDVAAIDFIKCNMNKTYKDYKERGAMIYEVKLYMESNKNVPVTRYIYPKVYKGGHANVVWAFSSNYFAKAWSGTNGFTAKWKKQNKVHMVISKKMYSFAHTHPYCTGHVGLEFSSQDKSLVNLFKIKYCYLGSWDGKVRRYSGGSGNGIVVSSSIPKGKGAKYVCNKKKTTAVYKDPYTYY